MNSYEGKSLEERWLRSVHKVTFLGILILQSWVDLVIWERLLNDYKELRAIIELGTYAGAFSTFLLLQTVQRGMSFWTFDIHVPPPTPLTEFVGLERHFYQGDLFAEETITYVASILMQDGLHPLMLYCDNGHKVNELDTYLPCLREGDLVGVHDFGTEIGKRWVSRAYGDKLDPVLWHECEKLGSNTRFWRVR